MNTRVTLAAIRLAIVKRQRASFIYTGHVEVVADLYLLGNARKTGAYVVVAWCAMPEWGWRILRFAEIRDFKTIGRAALLRGDYDHRHDRYLADIDTESRQPVRSAAG